MSSFLTAALLIIFSYSSAQAQSVDRSTLNEYLIGTATLSSQNMDQPMSAKQAQKFAHMRSVLPVLKGLLYRAGGPGGAKPLGGEQVDALCGLGFSAVDFAYSGQSPETVSCQAGGTANSLIYQTVPYDPKHSSVFLGHIYRAIKNNLGPVMVHCWNGWHESGLMAVYALMQFCSSKGWDAERGWQYWRSTTGDNPDNPQYLGIRKMIQSFQVQANMEITAAEINDLCPTN